MAAQDALLTAWSTVDRYVTLLRQRGIRVEHVYVFGSCVSGMEDVDSDIDVAIVSRDLTGRRLEDQLRLMELRRGIDLRIEPHPFRPERFTADNPEALEIMETGVRLKGM